MTRIESKIEKQIIKYLTKNDFWAIKISLCSVNGFPDRLVIGNNKIFFIEVKSPGYKADPLQVFVHNRLRRYGFEVIVADSLETVKYYIEG